jgi:hypothetical protein
MKAIKIIFAIAVVAVAGYFIWNSLITVKPPQPVKLATNQYTERIEKEIDSLHNTGINVFCKEFYGDILYRLNDYHQHGFLGGTAADNDQWQEILSKDLYTAYASKFVEQALYVFKGSEWRITDLSFIRKEANELRQSSFLERQSAVDSSFGNVRTILKKYDEIEGFIYTCHNYEFSDYDLNAIFPITDVISKIQRSKNYLGNRLDNRYVYNCLRLKDGLHGIPNKLFDTHVNYLSVKVSRHSGEYAKYDYQSDYSKSIYEPLKNQISQLDNSVYGIAEDAFGIIYIGLTNSLAADNRKAADHFRPKRN